MTTAIAQPTVEQTKAALVAAFADAQSKAKIASEAGDVATQAWLVFEEAKKALHSALQAELGVQCDLYHS